YGRCLGTHADVAETVVAVAGERLAERRAIVRDRLVTSAGRGVPDEPTFEPRTIGANTQTLDPVWAGVRETQQTVVASTPPSASKVAPKTRLRAVLAVVLGLLLVLTTGLVIIRARQEGGGPTSNATAEPDGESVGSASSAPEPTLAVSAASAPIADKS